MGAGRANLYPEAKLSWLLRTRLLASAGTGRFRYRLGSSDFSDKRDFQLRRLAEGARLASFVQYPFHVFEHAAAMREHLACSQARFAQNFGAEASTLRPRARGG